MINIPIAVIVSIGWNGRASEHHVYVDGMDVESFVEISDAYAFAAAFYDGIGYPGPYRGV